VAAPVHDAVLIETREGDLEWTGQQTLAIMEQAGRIILAPDSILRADARVWTYPERLNRIQRGLRTPS